MTRLAASDRPLAWFPADDDYLYIGCIEGTLPRPDSENGIFRIPK